MQSPYKLRQFSLTDDLVVACYVLGRDAAETS
jgi:hypothetical protein